MRLRECFHRLRVDGALVAIHSSLSNLPLLQKVNMVAQLLAKDTLSV